MKNLDINKTNEVAGGAACFCVHNPDGRRYVSAKESPGECRDWCCGTMAGLKWSHYYDSERYFRNC